MITTQQIHARNWMTCPRCDGGKAFTAKDIKQGAQCTYCDSRGEIPRHVKRGMGDSSSMYERQAGA